MKVDVERHVDRCVKCAQYKGVPSALLLYNSIYHLAVPLIVSALTSYNFLLVIKGVNTL